MGGALIAQGKGIWPVSSRKAVLNDTGFFGNGDDVDAVKNTEAHFRIAISAAKAEVMTTVCDLFRVVWAWLPDPEKQVWHRLCHVMRRVNGFAGPVDPETTFFAEHAKARKHHG